MRPLNRRLAVGLILIRPWRITNPRNSHWSRRATSLLLSFTTSRSRWCSHLRTDAMTRVPARGLFTMISTSSAYRV